MDGKDNLLWRHSALARPSRVKVMRVMLPLLQPDVLNNRAMEFSVNGCTAGGCVRKTIKLKVKHVDFNVNQHFLNHLHVICFKGPSYIHSKTLSRFSSRKSLGFLISMMWEHWNAIENNNNRNSVRKECLSIMMLQYCCPKSILPRGSWSVLSLFHVWSCWHKYCKHCVHCTL